MIILMTFLSSCWTCTHSHNALRDRLEPLPSAAGHTQQPKKISPRRLFEFQYSLRLEGVREAGHGFSDAADAGFADFAMAPMNSG
jgi:hypothetical protein